MGASFSLSRSRVSRRLTFRTPQRNSAEPLLYSPDSDQLPADEEVVKIETTEIASQFRKSYRALNFSYKSFLVNDEQVNNISDAAFSSPIIEMNEDEDWDNPKEVRMRCLGEAISSIKFLSLPKNLSEHLAPGFFHKATSYSLPGRPTCMIGMRLGFAIGLESGEIYITESPFSCLLAHHTGPITCLAGNADNYGGSFLISGSTDGEIVVWHIDCAKEKVMSLKEMKGKPKKSSAVEMLKLAKDNSRAVASFADSSVLVLDLSVRDIKSAGRAHEDPIRVLEISPSCKWFITAAQGNVVKIWDLLTANLLYSLVADEQIQPPSFDDSKIPLKGDISAIYISDSNEIYVFSTLSGAVILLKHNRIDTVVPIQYGVGAQILHVFANTEKQIYIYSGMTYIEQRLGEEVHWVKAISSPESRPYLLYKTVDKLYFELMDGSKFGFKMGGSMCEASAWTDLFGVIMEKQLIIYELEDLWNAKLVVPGLKAAVSTEIGTVLLSTEQHILRAAPGRKSHVQLVHSIAKMQYIIDFSPDGKLALINSSDTSIDLLDIQDCTVRLSFPEKGCNYAVVSLQSEFLFTYGAEGVKIRALFLDGSLVIEYPPEQSEFIHSVTFARNNSFVSMCSSRRTLLWDTRNQTLVIRCSQNSLRSGLFSTLKFYYIEFGSQMNISLFSLPARRRMLESSERTHKAALCRDDKFCVILTSSVLVLEFPTLVRIAELSSEVDNFAMLPGDEELITSGSSGHHIWNICEGRRVASVPNLGAVQVLTMVPTTNYVLAVDPAGGFMALNIKAYTEQFLGQEQPDIENIKLRGVNSVIHHIERYTLLGDLITNGHYHSDLAAVTISPYKINGLHIIAYLNLLDSLPSAFKAKTPIIKGAFGSPLTVAMYRRTRRCLEALLKHIISLQAENMTEFISAIHCINDDILDLIKSGSGNLMLLFEAVVTDHIQGSLLSQFIKPISALPLVRYTDSLFINPKDFGSQLDDEGANLMLISYHICVLKWNFELGSAESINLLRALANAKDTEILRSKLVGAMISYKWRSLWLVIVAYTILYFGLLVLLVMRIFSIGSMNVINQSFLLINLLFLVHEVFQARTLGLEYLRDIWNYIDIARATTCIAWVFMSFEKPEISFFTWIIVLLCFVRGLTHFRAFSITRYYVRMVLDVIKEASTFIILLFYTTFAFGMLYAVAAPDTIKSPADSWVAAYELNMGRFDGENTTTLQWTCFLCATLTNVIVMLNLLVSILGDAYEKVQMHTVEADTKEMIDTILEYESLMVWKRGSGQKQYIQSCSEGYEEEEEEDWKGRVSTIKKKIARVAKDLKADLKASTDDIKREVQESMKQLEANLLRRLQESKEAPSKSTRETLTARLQDLESHIRNWMSPAIKSEEE